MRGLLQSLGVALFLTVSVGQSASADPILVTDGRVVGGVAVVDDLDILETVRPSPPFAFFDRVTSVTAAEGSVIGTSTATQRSSVSPTRFHAAATAESFADAPNVGDFARTTGFSNFVIDFDLSTPYRFTLTDFMVVNDFQPTGTGEGTSFVDILISNADSSFQLIEGIGGGTGTRQLDRTGILLAGSYSLQAEASTEALGNPNPESGVGPLSHHGASFDLDFQLTPVPEPGSMLLLGSGLVALVSRRVWRAANART
jgi:hypothetical protein